MRTIDWTAAGDGQPGYIRMIDQTALPAETVLLDIRTVDDREGGGEDRQGGRVIEPRRPLDRPEAQEHGPAVRRAAQQ